MAAVLERVQQAQEGRGNVSAAIVPAAQLRARDEGRGGRCRDRTCDPIHVKDVLFR